MNSDNKLLTKALELADMGFWVFPLKKHSKTPQIFGWQKRATRSPEKIRAFWERFPESNIGIFTEKFGEDAALVVIDVDVKGSKNGEVEIKNLVSHGEELPKTFEVKTPSGGRHIYFCAWSPAPSSASQLAPGIDVRSKGAYVVGPGSVLPSGIYEEIYP